MLKVIKIDQYDELVRVWKYKPIHSNIDPMDLIIAEMAKEEYRIKKVAFLKELARAAYENPLESKDPDEYFQNQLKLRAERLATSEVSESNISHVLCCPVCGVNSLVVYDDIEDDADPITGIYTRAYRYTWQVRCLCCTFEINHHLDNASSYELPIEDYWTSKEL
jgi:hypothetical protein